MGSIASTYIKCDFCGEDCDRSCPQAVEAERERRHVQDRASKFLNLVEKEVGTDLVFWSVAEYKKVDVADTVLLLRPDFMDLAISLDDLVPA